MSEQPCTIGNLRFDKKHLYYLVVCLMEQFIGAALAVIIGVIVPMILLVGYPQISPWMQGLIAATSLIGIAVGALILGKLSDKHGYLFYFRLSPILIIIGSVIVKLFASDSVAWLMTGLFITGFGVGGGYALDSEYISELMPSKWKNLCLGIAKASSAIGFILGAIGCYLIITIKDAATAWPHLMCITALLGIITLLMRIRWWNSPAWYLDKGQKEKAQEAANSFFGNVALNPQIQESTSKSKWSDLFTKENFPKVIFSGLTWACEGVGVYGIGVFLPMLVAALGLIPADSNGLPRIEHSVEITAWINFFILPGFILGLFLIKRVWQVALLAWGFYICAAGLGLLLIANIFHLPVWISIIAFLIFEIALNAGPHLMTFVIPPQIYSINDRGIGVGMASMLGKFGAIIGVIIMPILLSAGGMLLVLIVCISVMILGGILANVYGRKVMPKQNN